MKLYQATANIITVIQIFQIRWLINDSCKSEKDLRSHNGAHCCPHSETYPEVICRTNCRFLILDLFRSYEIMEKK